MSLVPESTFKRFLPKSLFGRALLILMVPMLLVQLVAIYIFYERHWASINRHMASALAGEIVTVSRQMRTLPEAQRTAYFRDIEAWMGIVPTFHAAESLPASEELPIFTTLAERLETRLERPFSLQRRGNAFRVHIAQSDGVLTIEAPRKRLASSTTYIFTLWMVGAAAVLLAVAVLFLRNQIRPITRLAIAAEHFGKGQDSPGFRPQGAQEVRQAARAFINMKERISRQITGRVEMLAGISHDLRTPLTRIRLQLEMFGGEAEREKVTALKSDIAEMEYMIAEYLDYARGEGGEQATATQLQGFLHSVVEAYARQQKPVTLTMEGDAPVALKPLAMRRCLSNVIDNALRFGTHCTVSAQVRGRYVKLLVDDDGPGIPEDKRELVFLPFKKLDASRNLNSGGVGLGLAIVRDIIHGHGGEITLADSPNGGLRVAMMLPR